MQRSASFTVTSNGGLLNVLKTPCHICAAFDPHSTPTHQHPAMQQFEAIWDTGATGSVITQRVVSICGLRPTGMMKVHGVHGIQDSETFLVNFKLLNNTMVPGVTVTVGQLPAGADALIGMDIITQGDFSITNRGGRTVFSFRVPSLLSVDFVKEHNNEALKSHPLKTPQQPSKRRR